MPSRRQPAGTIPKLETCSQILDVISRFMNDQGVNTQEKINLWSCLTALRGPDSLDVGWKMATTAVIRHKLNLPDYLGFNVKSDSAESTLLRNSAASTRGQGHFMHHVSSAFDVLGLSWSNCNSPTPKTTTAKTAKRKR